MIVIKDKLINLKSEFKTKQELKMINKIKKNENKKYLSKRVVKKKVANSQIFSNVKSIEEDGIINLKTGEVAFFYKISPIDLSLTSESEQNIFFHTLSKLFRLPYTIKMYKFDEKINLNLNKEYHESLLEKNSSKIERKILLENSKSFLEELEKENLTTSSSYYFALISKNKQELEKAKENLILSCYSVNPKINIEAIKNKMILLKIFSKMYFANSSLDKLMYYDFIDLIMPINLIEKPSFIKAEDKEIQLVSIKNYPLFIEHGFLNRIINMPNVQSSITVKDTIEQDKLLTVLNSSFKAVLSDYNSSKNLSDVTEMKTLIDNYRVLIEQISNNDEKIKEVTVVLAITGSKLKREETLKEIKRYAELYHIKVDVPAMRQMELWQSYDLTSKGNLDYSLYLPTLTLASTWICTSIFHNDPKGWLIGEDSTYGLPVYFDPFYLSNERPSHNMVIFGSTGSGKSYLEKLLTTSEIGRAKIFVFDIENENKKLTKRCNGEYVDLSSKALINPLQVRYIEDDDEKNVSILSKHLGILENFFQTVFDDISEKELVVLLGVVERFYKRYNITKETSLSEYEKKEAKDYPIFSDLYNFLLKQSNNARNLEEKKILINVEVLLKRLITGQDGNLFNGITTIDLSNDLITFNLQELLFNSSKRLINTQMINLLTFLNNQIMDIKRKNDKANIKKHCLIVVDELHAFIDEDNPAILKYFDQLTRRLRKYNSAIVFCTQTPQDLINPRVLRHAVAIFNNCQYKLFGMLKEDDLQAVDRIFSNNKLTQAHKNFLLNAVQGQFLLSITNKQRIRINVFATPIQQYYMGESDNVEPL